MDCGGPRPDFDKPNPDWSTVSTDLEIESGGHVHLIDFADEAHTYCIGEYGEVILVMNGK